MSHSNMTRPSVSAQPPRKGDIRKLEGLLGLGAQPQLALVARAADSSHGQAEIILVHERVELATSDDVVLYPDSEQFPEGLVVQKLLRGAVWNLQFSTCFGRLTPEDMAVVGRSFFAVGSDIADSTTDPSDVNDAGEWSHFHESQLQALWVLTGDCTDAMLDDDTLPWRVDTGLLSKGTLSTHPRPEFILTEVMHILYTRQITATIDDSKDLVEYGSLHPSTWNDTDFGSDLASQIATGARKIVECSFRDSAYYAEQLNRGIHRFNVPHRIPEARELTLISPTRLVTAPFLWTDAGKELLSHSKTDGHSYSPVEVMMLATSDVSVHAMEDGSHEH